MKVFIALITGILCVMLSACTNGFSKEKLEELVTPFPYVEGISSAEMEGILCQVEAWIDKEENAFDEILNQSSKAKQQSMALDYLNDFDEEETQLIKRAVNMLNCTDFQDKLTSSQQKRKQKVYARIHRHEDRIQIIEGLFR